jgi:hypothetical protein
MGLLPLEKADGKIHADLMHNTFFWGGVAVIARL